MDHRGRDRLVGDVTRLGSAGLPLDALIDEAGAVLTRAVPHVGSCWHTIDPATVIETRFRTLDLPPHGDKVAEFEYTRDDFNKFADLARRPRHSGVLSEATGGDLRRSARYREFHHRYGIRGELRTALVVDGACWGSFVLFRAAPDDFTAAERDAAHDVAAILGGAFRAAVVHHSAVTDDPDRVPGLILLDGDRRVASASPTAGEWLDQLRFPGEPGPGGLPHVLRAVAENARVTGGDATARVPGRSGGWVAAHASPVRGTAGADIAIVLQAATAPSLAPLIAAAYGFTARERQVAELVLRGHGTAEIAGRLYISPHTVQEHLKSIFAKAGVRSRRELVGQVFLRHYRPALRPVERGTVGA